MATSYYENFIKKLKEIFMMDHAELDFGIYRIMNQKRSDIQDFLEKDLLPQVKQLLAENNSAASALNEELKQAIQACHSVGINPDESPKVMEIKKRMAASADVTALENEVFSHLTAFFSRYYDEGDFISKRRYKDNTYAIPYNGEEVKLYWANADQYYIKTSEYFKNYTFRLADHRAVHFVLKEASTEQNNNKAQNNQERRFALYEEEGEPTVEVIDGELNIYFTYELMPKATKQKNLNSSAVEKLKSIIPSEWAALMQPVSNTDSRLLIEKHLTDYTAKNSFDYFIHKDLGGFLRRELDFYIKNEVMHLDDLDTAHIQAQLSTVKAIKGVGEKIIRMLASIEDFQKKLWLKKKFVVQTDYCVTLDRVPEELYADIIANDRQREEWVRLFAIDDIKGDLTTEAYSEPLTMEFLRQNPFLVLDTAFFSPQFKHKLISRLGDNGLDEQCNGLLINSENFQALELLQEKYKNSIQDIYADPPYNTSASEIVYKNSYKHSSWLSLMHNRLSLGKSLLNKRGIQCTTIDDVEQSKLSILLGCVFDEIPDAVTIRIKPSGRPIPNGFAISHEYALFSKKMEDTAIARLTHSEEQAARYREQDGKGRFFWELLRKAGSNSFRENRPTMYYPLFVDRESLNVRLPDMVYNEERAEYILDSNPYDTEQVVYPIKDDGKQGCWYYGVDRAEKEQHELKAVPNNKGSFDLYRRRRPNEGVQPTTSWIDSKYSATEHGTDLLKRLFGQQEKFSYPKSIYAVEDCLRVSDCKNDSLVLDYFAGSGTTGHAVINLNRDDNGDRKYILCEMAEYFNSVTKPRIEKVIYSSDWQNGKPVSRQGISQCFKYIRLEQYEDTLNNLELKQSQQSTIHFEEGSSFKESYMLSYMLDTETRDSLLNLKMFENPFAMTFKTTKDNELVETPVDMVETFNFLIGLHVETEHWHKDGNICVVEGVTHRKNEKALVIWRNCEVVDNQALNRFFEKMDYSTLARDFDVIYVNGDNTLPNLRRDEDGWKVVLIEAEFKNRMFEED